MLRRYACGCCATEQERRAAQVHAGEESKHEDDQNDSVPDPMPIDGVSIDTAADKSVTNIQTAIASQNENDMISRFQPHLERLRRVMRLPRPLVAPDATAEAQDNTQIVERPNGVISKFVHRALPFLGRFKNKTTTPVHKIKTTTSVHKIKATKSSHISRLVSKKLSGISSTKMFIRKTAKRELAKEVIANRRAQMLRDLEHISRGESKSGFNRALFAINKMSDGKRRKRLARERKEERQRQVDEAFRKFRALLPEKIATEFVASSIVPKAISGAIVAVIAIRAQQEQDERDRVVRERLHQKELERQMSCDESIRTLSIAIDKAVRHSCQRETGARVFQRALRTQTRKRAAAIQFIKNQNIKLRELRIQWRVQWQTQLKVATVGLWEGRRQLLAKRQARLDLLNEVREESNRRQRKSLALVEDAKNIEEALNVPFENKFALKLPARDVDKQTVPMLPANSPKSKAVLNWVGVPVGVIRTNTADVTDPTRTPQEDDRCECDDSNMKDSTRKCKKARQRGTSRQQHQTDVHMANQTNNKNNNGHNDDDDAAAGSALLVSGNSASRRRRASPRQQQFKMVYQPVPRVMFGLQFTQDGEEPRATLNDMEERERARLGEKLASQNDPANEEEEDQTPFFNAMDKASAARYDEERRGVWNGDSTRML